MCKVVISGYYGFDNLGDEAVLAGCIKGLREINPDVEITVLSHTPGVTEGRYNVNSVARNNMKKVIGILGNSDLFLSGGGSLLQDVTGWKSIPYYLGQVLLADILNNKTVFYAQGIGPVTSKINKKLIKWIGNRCDLITLRDQKSRELLQALGVDEKLIKVYTDPAFILQPEHTGNYFPEKENVIGVVVRPWRDNKYLPLLITGLEYLADTLPAEIVIIPYHYYEDRKIARQLQEQLKCEAKVLADKYTPGEMLNIFSSLDFCIGIRLHSLIFAAISKIPFIGISYDPKVEAFLQKLGINCKLQIDNLSAELLIGEVEQVWQNKEKFVRRNTVIIKNFRELALKNIYDILELI